MHVEIVFDLYYFRKYGNMCGVLTCVFSCRKIDTGRIELHITEQHATKDISRLVAKLQPPPPGTSPWEKKKQEKLKKKEAKKKKNTASTGCQTDFSFGEWIQDLDGQHKPHGLVREAPFMTGDPGDFAHGAPTGRVKYVHPKGKRFGGKKGGGGAVGGGGGGGCFGFFGIGGGSEGGGGDKGGKGSGGGESSDEESDSDDDGDK